MTDQLERFKMTKSKLVWGVKDAYKCMSIDAPDKHPSYLEWIITLLQLDPQLQSIIK